MEEKTTQDEREPIEYYEGMELPEHMKPKEMDRGTQTAWIVAAILLVGLVIIYFQTRLPEGHPHKQCETLFGVDNGCLVWGPGGFKP